MPITDQTPIKVPAKPPTEGVALPDDGTNALLKTGFWIVLVSLFFLLLTKTVFGGIGIYGARSDAGWLTLMFTLMGLPFGLMLLVLGIAKWLRNRRLRRNAA